MNKGFKKFIAVVCAIAMVVSSLTVYNNKVVKAVDWTDVSGWQTATFGENTYYGMTDTNFKTTGKNNYFTEFKKMDGAYLSSGPAVWVMFSNGVCSKIVINGTDYTSTDFGGNPVSDKDVLILGAQVFINPALLNVKQNIVGLYNGDTLLDTLYVYNPNGSGEITTPDPNVPTTTPAPTELQKPAAPTALVANINDLKTDYTIAFAPVTGATSFNLYIDGEYKKEIGNGTAVTIAELGLEAGKKYIFGVSSVNAAGESDITTIEVTVPTAEETTQPESTKPAEEFDPSTITDWTPVSSTVSIYDKDSKLNVKEMHGNDLYLAFGMAGAFKSITLDGVAKTPGGGADYTVSAADIAAEGIHTLVVVDYYGTTTATVYIKCTKSEETTSAPSTTCKVTVDDGTPETVKKGSKYTLGDNTYGYTIDGTNYKPGSEIVVNEDITVKSINVELTMTDGAGIKLSDPTGIRFQANLVTNASIKESGMLLSANDFMDNAHVTELTTDALVKKVNISNGTGTGKYIGALVNINNYNYKRDFTARAYVTISYGDSDVTYYSEKSMTRNIKDVANGLIDAGKTSGLTEKQIALVNTFAGR